MIKAFGETEYLPEGAPGIPLVLEAELREVFIAQKGVCWRRAKIALLYEWWWLAAWIVQHIHTCRLCATDPQGV